MLYFFCSKYNDLERIFSSCHYLRCSSTKSFPKKNLAEAPVLLWLSRQNGISVKPQWPRTLRTPDDEPEVSDTITINLGLDIPGGECAPGTGPAIEFDRRRVLIGVTR
mmetsp:Transcript_14618/g.40474  ORF Transcript_14618/g.40474 Transcript_14618/m.40474 type:complete len:108 (+) Transcript_14618:39-362(+)